eukprot:TRINITY_DN10487_c0_g1_i7.p2 TRINITY_DN10487_c0_g1~~TRINITY_DN10487_c0_g1_i7.p2  ORF type:complete len:359 (+),score=138.94 TRINITY_DN10487_c0_g1_i7:102-1178(+)
MAAGAAEAAAPAFEPQPAARTREALAGKVPASAGQPLAGELECPICDNPAFECPVKTKGCEHLFHKTCLERWLQGKTGNAHSCPVCRTVLPAGAAAIISPGREVLKLLRAIEVDCPQDCERPRKRMRYDMLQEHIDSCPQTLVRCNGVECAAVLPREEMERAHAPACSHVLVTCEECDTEVKRASLQVHLKEECERRRVTCDRCQTADVIWCDRAKHQLVCTGAANMCDVAELRQMLVGLQDELRLTQLALFLKVPLYVRVSSSEKPSSVGTYKLLPHTNCGAGVWGRGRFRIFKDPDGDWCVTNCPEDIKEGKGLLFNLSLRKEASPAGSKGWRSVADDAWVPAPNTTVVAVDGTLP